MLTDSEQKRLTALMANPIPTVSDEMEICSLIKKKYQPRPMEGEAPKIEALARAAREVMEEQRRRERADHGQ